MPIPYDQFQLYDLNEITGQLRNETLQGKNPVARIVQLENGQWIIEILRGTLQNLTMLGYLRESNETVPRAFQSSTEALEAISWCDDYIKIMS